MGRSRAFAALLTLAAVSAAAPLPIREANWIAPEARLEALTSEPGRCSKTALEDVQAVTTGEVAFRTPFLLGGQAARTGMSCASCHRNGRGNPHFVFPGISGAPGTADVTASILSSHRGDGAFNPKSIPNLAADPPKVLPGEIRSFIRGLIIEEFDGAEPPPRVLDGLVAYIGRLKASRCGDAARAITLELSLRHVAVALAMAVKAYEAKDAATARLMTLAARSELGRIDERFPGEQFITARAKLDVHDKMLRENLRLLGSGHGAEHGLHEALLIPGLIRKELAALEPRSLYNPQILKRALAD